MPRFRVWLTLAGSVVILGSILTIASVWEWDVGFGLPHSTDKVTRINTIVAASAYIAAIVAAIFALIAYWQASGLPSLKPAISFLQKPTLTLDVSINQVTETLDVTPMLPPSWTDTSSAPFPPLVESNPSLIVTVVADGCRPKEFKFPLNLALPSS